MLRPGSVCSLLNLPPCMDLTGGPLRVVAKGLGMKACHMRAPGGFTRLGGAVNTGPTPAQD